MVMMYMIVFLAVTFGLFNLILAVFVEHTMASAQDDERKRRRHQGDEDLRVRAQLTKLVARFANHVKAPGPRRSGFLELINVFVGKKKSEVAEEEEELPDDII